MSNELTTGQIAMMTGGRLRGSANVMIRGLAKIEEAQADQLSFISSPRYLQYLATTGAGALLVTSGLPEAKVVLIEVADPYGAFRQLLPVFHPASEWLDEGVHSTAAIDPTAVLGKDVAIGAFCYIGPRVEIGDRTRLYPHTVIAADVKVGSDCIVHSHVSIRERVIVGDFVIIQDGAVIGSDGFGYAPAGEGYQKIPHLGTVHMQDLVEVGANTTIDRATIGQTTLGRGTKLDNLIQVAHNVTIGSHTVVAAQSGFSGSAIVGDHCRIGGQVGIVGHLRIGNKVSLAAQSGVASEVSDGEIYAGSPARPHRLWKRIEAAVTRLPELYRRVRRLEAAILPDRKSSDEEM